MTSESKFVDILGQTITVGDCVVYPSQRGRSVQMTIGQVCGFSKSGIQIQRMETSRWGTVATRSKTIDTRTGKGINKYLGGHIKEEAYRRHKVTLERLGYQEFYRLHYPEQQDYEYVPTVFQDWVQSVEVPSAPVTVRNLKNVIKVDYDPTSEAV